MKAETKSNSSTLAVGGIAALLASGCCLGPLIVVMLGFSGAWIGNLTKLEPYRPFFLTLTFIALGSAGYQIFRRQSSCPVQGTCATPHVRPMQIIAFCAVVVLTLLAVAFPYVAPHFY